MGAPVKKIFFFMQETKDKGKGKGKGGGKGGYYKTRFPLNWDSPDFSFSTGGEVAIQAIKMTEGK